MTRSLTIARISDIDVRLHPTFALVFLWVLIDWRRLGGGQDASAILFTLALVVLVFGCVLLHEFGHALMARQFGVRVHDVSLSAVGGVARMEQLPFEPRAEVLISLAGPAAKHRGRGCPGADCPDVWDCQWLFLGGGIRSDRLRLLASRAL